jgi:xanthine/uracil permease
MLYAFPILIALMLGFMFWLAAFRLRRDRIAVARLAQRPRRTQRRRAVS